MRETCDELAAQRYGALCPDLFWRMEPGVELSAFNDAEWRRGLALYQAFDINQGVEDVATALAFARELPGASGKVGVMGFCLGGLLTFLTAARLGADAAVAYYGGGTERYVWEGRKLSTPLMLHLAEEDEFISKSAQTEFRDMLSSAATRVASMLLRAMAERTSMRKLRAWQTCVRPPFCDCT